MILEFDDGRELKLPDEMPDETARQIKRLIQTLEERARTAESETRLLRDEMATLRHHVGNLNAASVDHSATVNAIRESSVASIAMLRQIFQATSGDRVVVPDPITGDMTRSRVVM